MSIATLEQFEALDVGARVTLTDGGRRVEWTKFADGWQREGRAGLVASRHFVGSINAGIVTLTTDLTPEPGTWLARGAYLWVVTDEPTASGTLPAVLFTSQGQVYHGSVELTRRDWQRCTRLNASDVPTQVPAFQAIWSLLEVLRAEQKSRAATRTSLEEAQEQVRQATASAVDAAAAADQLRLLAEAAKEFMVTGDESDLDSVLAEVGHPRNETVTVTVTVTGTSMVEVPLDTAAATLPDGVKVGSVEAEAAWEFTFDTEVDSTVGHCACDQITSEMVLARPEMPPSYVDYSFDMECSNG